jgi:SDR family mycofactocin-dependent oxidoreductase
VGLLDGKVAFITGGARGQGRAHALTMAREGADIIIMDLCGQADTVLYPMSVPEDMQETVAAVEGLGRKVLARQGDVRNQSQIDAVVGEGIETLGKIDILVANAGIWQMGNYWELSEDQWAETIDINLNGVWRAAKAVTPHMIEREEGSMVLVSSTNGLEGGYNYAHYASAKHGVLGLMRSIAIEVGKFNIRCNAVCPGIIDTKINDWQGAYDVFAGHGNATPADRVFAAANWNLLARRNLLPPEAVANAALYLNSDMGNDITGVYIAVDAGHIELPGFNTAPVR